ncbi:ras guanine nucleotide exchange factor domain-containing protein, partial [Endogone sp. FLAS-F59071]
FRAIFRNLINVYITASRLCPSHLDFQVERSFFQFSALSTLNALNPQFHFQHELLRRDRNATMLHRVINLALQLCVGMGFHHDRDTREVESESQGIGEVHACRSVPLFINSHVVHHQALRNMNNYNTLMAILAGINSAPIMRLKNTRDLTIVKKMDKPKWEVSLNLCEVTIKSEANYDFCFGTGHLAHIGWHSKIRNRLEYLTCEYFASVELSLEPPLLVAGIHLQDLLSLVEGNRDFRSDGAVHWDKFRLMGETIINLRQFQSRYVIGASFVSSACRVTEELTESGWDTLRLDIGHERVEFHNRHAYLE